MANDPRMPKFAIKPSNRPPPLGDRFRIHFCSILLPTGVTADPKQPGSETVAQLFVPEGFSVDVIAAEPNLHQPMAFTFDATGRLWAFEDTRIRKSVRRAKASIES